jgi:Mrp family chromosome partitioning ATPase
VRNGLIQLKAVSSPILGVVLNGVDMDRDGYYYYQYYYYYYGEDGTKKKRAHRKKKSTIGYGQEADR